MMDKRAEIVSAAIKKYGHAIYIEVNVKYDGLRQTFRPSLIDAAFYDAVLKLLMMFGVENLGDLAGQPLGIRFCCDTLDADSNIINISQIDKNEWLLEDE